MMRRTGLLVTALAFVAHLSTAPACPAQAAKEPMFNTAGTGAKPADVEAAVSAICPTRFITRAKDGSASGCSACPVGTDFYGDKTSKWEMYAASPGHFTSAHDDNLILDGYGCDSHAMNFGGSFVFLLKEGAKPRLLKYDQGLITDQCHKFSYADGRNFLVCRGGWTGQGESNGTVFVTSFGPTGKDTSTILMTSLDTTGTCVDDRSTVVQSSGISDIKFAVKDSGELTGMTIVATLGKIKCSETDAKRKPGELPAAVKTYEIEFLFDGKQFKVAPTSKAALNRFDQN